MGARNTTEELLITAGVQTDGGNLADIRVLDDRFYGRVIREGSLGLGEAYMDRWWDCERLDNLIYRLLMADLEKIVRKHPGR
ncbi:hypothetical protein J3L18_31260 [Mucilaginibacter gossypii]|uniref:hypothetical protein n=1 Tax=Mucilaginibacter gossypii TaxID=551996 RepID=UPI001CB8E067|nr:MULTISPECIES: hypothetical protein [Mucilaginibacter]WMH62852.1 hypothetical protein J3L18_31260 [Mucilaginibacter gossypii]